MKPPFNEWTPRGGHKTHLVPPGEDTALCGFKPGGKTRMGRARAGWLRSATFFFCKACQQKAKEQL